MYFEKKSKNLLKKLSLLILQIFQKKCRKLCCNDEADWWPRNFKRRLTDKEREQKRKMSSTD